MVEGRETDLAPGLSRAEAVTRLVRHEVADLLQGVYATVALLRARLPSDWETERRILDGLHAQSQLCADTLDGAHALICPLNWNAQPVDLGALATTLVARVAVRYPHLQVQVEVASAPAVLADPDRLTLLGRLLLTEMCEAAQKQVWVRSGPASRSGEVEWSVTDDGPAVFPNQSDEVVAPAQAPSPSRLGLGLALARKLVGIAGGSVETVHAPAGGLCVRIRLPADTACVGGAER